jgi:hypothetical protein
VGSGRRGWGRREGCGHPGRGGGRFLGDPTRLAETRHALRKSDGGGGAAAISWLKLPTTRGIQDFMRMPNILNLSPPWRNLSRAPLRQVVQGHVLSPHEPPHVAGTSRDPQPHTKSVKKGAQGPCADFLSPRLGQNSIFDPGLGSLGHCGH